MKIVYTSNTGHTAKYAKLLAEKTGLPAYELKQAKKELANGEEIVYLGWIMAGGVKGLNAAQKKFTVKACCAVGMAPAEAQKTEDMKSHNGWSGEGFFVLQGGYAPEKLKGLNKIMLNVVTSSTIKKLSAKPDLTEADKEMIEGMSKGYDSVSAEALEPVAAWLAGK